MKATAAGLRHAIDEAVETRFGVLVVDADAALHRDGNAGGLAHRRDALADKIGLGHQAGAEPPGLHAIGRAADIEVDLVIAVARADLRRFGEALRIAAAELEPDRMLLGREAEHALAIAVEHGLRRHHLGIEEGPPRDQPQEVAAVAVGPLHHRRDTEFMRSIFHVSTLLGGRYCASPRWTFSTCMGNSGESISFLQRSKRRLA